MTAPATCSIRIVKDTTSRDGWIGRTRKGQVCFIDNLDTQIDKLVAGQQWNARIVRHRPTFIAVELISLIKH